MPALPPSDDTAGPRGRAAPAKREPGPPADGDGDAPALPPLPQWAYGGRADLGSVGGDSDGGEDDPDFGPEVEL